MATSTSLYKIYEEHPEYFVEAKEVIDSKEKFIEYYSKSLRDFNSAGVVCAHLGRTLSSMKQGYYPVYSENAKVNAEKIKECKNAIDEIIVKL